MTSGLVGRSWRNPRSHRLRSRRLPSVCGRCVLTHESSLRRGEGVRLVDQVEDGALAAQFLQPGVGDFIEGVELVEGLDQERAAAARQVENAEALQRFLPRFPEADEGFALRFVEGGQVVGIGIGQRLAGGARGF